MGADFNAEIVVLFFKESQSSFSQVSFKESAESTEFAGYFYKQECLSALCRASFVDVYLAYLKSYGHLKIVKCIGMY